MATKDEARDIQRQCDAVVDQIRPIMGGQDPKLQGFVCAELLAMHIAGWPAEARDEMMATIIGLTKDLIPFYAKHTDRMRNPEGNA